METIINPNLLIIFYRNPELGKVKSRLAKTVGEEKALAIYLKMVSHARYVSSCSNADKIVFYSEYVDTEDNWLNEVFEKETQLGSSLGEKMANAFEYGFNKGYKKICIIGTDCPDLTCEIIQEAFEKLNSTDAVIGPATDGGYYLLGMNEYHPEFFENKKWSTDSVLTDTIEDFKRLNLNYFKLQTLTDIDYEKDLQSVGFNI
jgi:rSAM/selenodomain-associated transferase 1